MEGRERKGKCGREGVKYVNGKRARNVIDEKEREGKYRERRGRK